ncbi:MAG: transposase [Methylocystis sp.]
MLSVILLGYEAAVAERGARRDERVLRSLASLVEGAVDGLVADVALAGPVGAGFAGIADEAGCLLIENDAPAPGLAEALAVARQPNVFLLLAGYAVDRGFIEEARDALAFGGLERARVLRAAPGSLLTRLAPSLARPVGVIARKQSIERSAASDLAGLVRALRGVDCAAQARKCV